MLTNVFVLLALLFFSAFFSGSEVALFSLSKSELLRLSSSSRKLEKTIAALMVEPRKILVTILIGNLLANLLLPAFTTRILLEVFPRYGHFMAIAIVTPLIIILCDITPKTITRSDPEGFSRRVARLLQVFHRLFMPFREALLAVNNAIIALFGLDQRKEDVITEDELDMAVKMGEKDGIIGKEEGAFIKNVLRFSKKEAQNIMIPRNQAVFIPYGSSIEDAASVFRTRGLVRALVYRKDFDDVVGVLDSRRLVPYLYGYKKARNINRLLFSIYHYPATKELGDLLVDFLANKLQIAVVIDEYGGTAGVVTLSGILSELLGVDFAMFQEGYKPAIRKTGGNSSIISGEMQIDDFNLTFNENLASKESETIGGYIIERLGYFPAKDEFIETGKYVLRVRRVEKKRIHSIEVLTGGGR
ncbi:MAG TPA: hemolysin family protein [Spirochaetota bacterium]|nr:MAG: Magnesium and cobalt efflux protein CorC [Spirochaetes bacterium ADurb.BinA120]HPI15652.1 hemolysin family protein [Spirochaetota bacterium]